MLSLFNYSKYNHIYTSNHCYRIKYIHSIHFMNFTEMLQDGKIEPGGPKKKAGQGALDSGDHDISNIATMVTQENSFIHLF